DVGHEIALALLRDGVEHARGGELDVALDAREQALGERRRDEAPKPAVLRRVRVDHRAEELEELRRDFSDRRRPLARAEELRMRTGMEDVSLARERPESRAGREHAVIDFPVERDRPLATERAERALADVGRERPEHRIAELDLLEGQLFSRFHRATMRR